MNEIGTSVTRFGENSPLWQNYTSIWLYFQSWLLCDNILNLLWQIFMAKCSWLKRTNIETLVTLIGTKMKDVGIARLFRFGSTSSY